MWEHYRPKPKCEYIEARWIDCRKSGCRSCASGPSHGPYHYRRWWEGRRLRTEYLGREIPAEYRHLDVLDMAEGASKPPAIPAETPMPAAAQVLIEPPPMMLEEACHLLGIEDRVHIPKREVVRKRWYNRRHVKHIKAAHAELLDQALKTIDACWYPHMVEA